MESLLQSKFDFSRAENREVGHRYYALEVPGLPTIITKFSSGNDEIDVSLETLIARQLLVKRPFFARMLDCTRSRADYERQIREAPFKNVPYRR